MDKLLGQKIELHKVNQNEALRMSVSGEIVDNYQNAKNVEGFYLLKLDTPFEHAGIDSDHVLFWSPLIHRKKNIEDHSDAFILLIPDMGLLNQPHIDEEAFIPFDWAKVTRKSYTEEGDSNKFDDCELNIA